MDEHQIARLATEISHEAYQHDASSPSQDGGAAKRKATDDGPGQPQQRSKRNRYISIACNECKRRKIKCNGQTPCHRCGNLNLECVYAPNCCSGFKESLEYKEMTAQVGALQEQVNTLFQELNNVCAQLGRGGLPQQQHNHQQSLPAQQQQHQQQQSPTASHRSQSLSQQQQQQTPIDPSLQAATPYPPPRSFYPGAQSSSETMSTLSPVQAPRPRSQSQNNPRTFRGPTSDAYNFGVAKSSLQTMGITSPNEDGPDASGGSQGGTREGSPDRSPGGEGRGGRRGDLERGVAVLPGVMHVDKDPIWSVSLEEALRLCRIYEEEMGLMYPVLDIKKVIAYTEKLFRFMNAARQSGLMSSGKPGADTLDDDDTNILKLVLAAAMTMEASGKSDLGRRMFEYVRPAVESQMLRSVGIKGVQALAITAMYEFHRDNESTSWRLTGLAARLCIELGLHRKETYDALQDESERWETILLFWAIYVLDRRWSLGTGMPFALQEGDVDPLLPKPGDQSPYLTAMIQYSAIGSRVWRTIAATPSTGAGTAPINVEEMGYLDYQVLQWHRNIPEHLRFEPSSQQGRSVMQIPSESSTAEVRLCILLYLRANQMRILIFRPVLHSATSIMQHREQSQTVVDVAKDSIRVLTHMNQTSSMYRSHQVLFNAFLTSALAVLFLAVSHTPALFAEKVREEFYMALELVRGFSSGSWVSKRLWKTIRVLKEVAPKLGLAAKDSSSSSSTTTTHQQHGASGQQPRRGMNEELDPSRSAAVAMAGLAGHNVDEMALFGNGSQDWSAGVMSNTSPSGMVDDLTTLFEAAGGYAEGTAVGDGQLYHGMGAPDGVDQIGFSLNGDDGLSQILRDLF